MKRWEAWWNHAALAAVSLSGLAYQPIPQLILKADWQQRHNAAKTGTNVFNASLGYVF